LFLIHHGMYKKSQKEDVMTQQVDMYITESDDNLTRDSSLVSRKGEVGK